MEVSELLAKKRQLLLKSSDGQIVSAIIDPAKANQSTDGKYIELGGYYSDTTYGWHEIEEVARSVVGVVKEFDPAPQEPLPEGYIRWWPFGA